MIRKWCVSTRMIKINIGIGWVEKLRLSGFLWPRKDPSEEFRTLGIMTDLNRHFVKFMANLEFIFWKFQKMTIQVGSFDTCFQSSGRRFSYQNIANKRSYQPPINFRSDPNKPNWKISLFDQIVKKIVKKSKLLQKRGVFWSFDGGSTLGWSKIALKFF